MFEKLPATRHERWELMREFIARWYAPLTPADGFSEEEISSAEQSVGLQFPRALREWYALAGRRRDVWSQQDELLLPSKCYVVGEVLVVYVENQSVVRWAIPLSGQSDDDPPVVVESVDASEHWFDDYASLSEFALQMLVFSGKWSDANRFSAAGAADEAVLRQITNNYPRLDFPDWHWPDFPTRTYGNDDILIETNGDGESAWLWVWSRSEGEFRQLDRLVRSVGVRWQAFFD